MHRCAPLPATVRRRGARRASWLMQLCPRCFRELRASETAWGTGWRARRARATHSRLDGSERSTVRRPLKSWDRCPRCDSKNAPSFLATFIGSISTYKSLLAIHTQGGKDDSPKQQPQGPIHGRYPSKRLTDFVHPNVASAAIRIIILLRVKSVGVARSQAVVLAFFI